MNSILSVWILFYALVSIEKEIISLNIVGIENGASG